jgi:hypothetical protein
MEEAERKFDMTIIMHNTGEHMHLHPQYDELIHLNDTLVVFATLETLGKIGAVNHNHTGPRVASQNLIKRMFNRR